MILIITKHLIQLIIVVVKLIKPGREERAREIGVGSGRAGQISPSLVASFSWASLGWVGACRVACRVSAGSLPSPWLAWPSPPGAWWELPRALN